MKFKGDFVTNSSSTSFIFVFKGDHKIDLFRQMVKHEEDFNLYNEYGGGDPKVNVWEIIRAIDPIIKSTTEDPYYLPSPSTVKKHVETLKEELAEHEEQLVIELEREKGQHQDRWMGSEYTARYIKNTKHKIKKYESFMKKGLNNLIEISFGDNDGVIQGGRIGITMDYAGRNIQIDDDEFAVVIENCH